MLFDTKIYKGFCTCFLLMLMQQGFAQQQFSNPLVSSGADPWIIEKDGFYYFTHTTGKNIVLYKTNSFAAISSAPRKVVWEPPDSTMYSKQIWAPELHFIKGKWYFYFAADDGINENHRVYVLENKAADPTMGEWVLKGKVADATNKWAIDASVFKFKNKWYMAWSGWEGDTNGQQDIFIAAMKNPWTIKGKRVKISSPQLHWEIHGDLNDPLNPPHVSVNEGPQWLLNNKKLFIVYSASGCWTDNYGLGLLTFTGKRKLLRAANWRKSPDPVFSTSVQDSVFAPGHNSFFKSPDKKEDWILYHANSAPAMGCGGGRTPRAQKFSWKADGSPDFGKPVKAGKLLDVPSGSINDNSTIK
jgi:GH43 family beta-xylosidase